MLKHEKMKHLILLLILFPISCVGQGKPIKLFGKSYDIIDTIFLEKRTNGDFVVVLYASEAPAFPLILYSYKGNISYYPNAVLTCRYCFGKVSTNVPTLHGYTLKNRKICFRQDIFGRYDSIYVDFSSDIPYVTKVIIHHWNRPSKSPHHIDEKGSVMLIPRKNKTRLDAFSPPIDLEDPEITRLFIKKAIPWHSIN